MTAAARLKPLAPGDYVIGARAMAAPQHAHVPFRPLPCIADEDRAQPDWGARQAILRLIARRALEAREDDEGLIADLERMRARFGDGWADYGERVAQDLGRPEVLSPLLAAATAGRARLVRYLLRPGEGARGAPPDQPSEWNGRTAAMIAASRGDDATLAELIAAGANLLRTDANGATALAYAIVGAVRWPSPAVVWRLLRACPELLGERALPHEVYERAPRFWRDAIAHAREALRARGAPPDAFADLELVGRLVFAPALPSPTPSLSEAPRATRAQAAAAAAPKRRAPSPEFPSHRVETRRARR